MASLLQWLNDPGYWRVKTLEEIIMAKARKEQDSGTAAFDVVNSLFRYKLPPELVLHVCRGMSAWDSLCVGLTSKKLYDIHFQTHGQMPLIFTSRMLFLSDFWGTPSDPRKRIQNWIGEKGSFLTCRGTINRRGLMKWYFEDTKSWRTVELWTGEIRRSKEVSEDGSVKEDHSSLVELGAFVGPRRN